MSITLSDVLMLAGRLDDTPGFDTPRERFRRFLSAHVTSAQVGALIEQSQPLVDEQLHRALQDLVVLLGRFLGFETTFGTYTPLAGGLKYEGFWRSRAGLDVVLEIRTNLTSDTDLDSLGRSIAARVAASRAGSQARVVGLFVVTTLYTGRGRLEQSLVAAKPDLAIRIGSVRSLLLLADMASAGRLSHDDIVELLDTGSPLDAAANSFHRQAHQAEPDLSLDDRSPARETQTGPGFWLATVAGDNVITPERFLEVVIGRRRIFGVHAAEHASDAARPGDRICFHVTERGAVGQADVASIEESGTGLRDAHQYSQLLRLENIELHLDGPVVPESEMLLRLRVVQGVANSTWQPFIRISERDFLGLTGTKDRDSVNGDPEVSGSFSADSEKAPTKRVSDGDSRSRE
jgi:hypothetical protein